MSLTGLNDLTIVMEGHNVFLNPENTQMMEHFAGITDGVLPVKWVNYLKFYEEDLQILRRRGVAIKVECLQAKRVLWAAENNVWCGQEETRVGMPMRQVVMAG